MQHRSSKAQFKGIWIFFYSAAFSLRIQTFPRQHVAYSNRIRLSTSIRPQSSSYTDSSPVVFVQEKQRRERWLPRKGAQGDMGREKMRPLGRKSCYEKLDKAVSATFFANLLIGCFSFICLSVIFYLFFFLLSIAVIRNPVNYAILFSTIGSTTSFGRTRCNLDVVSDLKTVRMPCFCRQRRSCSNSRV